MRIRIIRVFDFSPTTNFSINDLLDLKSHSGAGIPREKNRFSTLVLFLRVSFFVQISWEPLLFT